jgi:hypothetical protein
MDFHKISIGLVYINIKLDNNLINEFEIGFDLEFNLNYQHEWYRTQVHFLSLGNTYIYWRGFPFLDKKS